MPGKEIRKIVELYGETPLDYNRHVSGDDPYYGLGEQPQPHLTNYRLRSPLGGGGGSLPMTTKIYDIGNSVLMGLDILGTVSELHSDNPVTVGGKACKRNRDYITGLVPEDYEPQLGSDRRVKKYFQEQGLEIAPANVYAGWMATFFSWPLLIVIQPINAYNLLRKRIEEKALERRLQNKEQGTD